MKKKKQAQPLLLEKESKKMKSIQGEEVNFLHSEAFCLMKYRSEDHSETEILWNSRDGVTPFVIDNRAGTKRMQHIEWEKDKRDPFHQPKAGDRIFIDLTEERAREHAIIYVDKNWSNPGYPMSAVWPTKDVAVEHFVKSWTETHEGKDGPPAGFTEEEYKAGNRQPDVFTVTEEWLEIFNPLNNFKANLTEQ